VIHKLHDDGKKGYPLPPSVEKGNTGPKAKQSASFRSMSAVTKSTSRESVGCLISWASRLDTDAGLAPVTSLGVVSEEASVSLEVLHVRVRLRGWLSVCLDG
jgi:hypothetical protein